MKKLVLALPLLGAMTTGASASVLTLTDRQLDLVTAGATTPALTSLPTALLEPIVTSAATIAKVSTSMPTTTISALPAGLLAIIPALPISIPGLSLK